MQHVAVTFQEKKSIMGGQSREETQKPKLQLSGDVVSLHNKMKFNFELSQNKRLREFSFPPPFYITRVFLSLPVSLGFQFLYPTTVCSASGKIWRKELQMENMSPCFYPPLPPPTLLLKKRKMQLLHLLFFQPRLLVLMLSLVISATLFLFQKK